MLAGNDRSHQGLRRPAFGRLRLHSANLGQPVAVLEPGGLAEAKEVDAPTLVDRLRDETVSKEMVVYPPRLIGAWIRAVGR